VTPRQRARAVLVGAVATRSALALLRAVPPGGAARWERENHAGRAVSLLAGPAFVVGAGFSGRPELITAVVGAGAVGLYDDLVERCRPTAKGIRGHLGELAHGRVSTGAVKVVGLTTVGCAVALSVSRRPVDVLVGAALVAGYANLANLLDLRPGRCLKFGLLHGPVAPGAAGAAVALLPADLREQVMLGDCGANAIGAALGTAALLRHGRPGRLATLTAVVALTLASERRSFSEVIAENPVLRRVDELGRRPEPVR
jgi:UDP-GlcNAc:undecaprenyl-phosphate/decaprenyl-phosphate GlcNAc-1-phosphate transferase